MWVEPCIICSNPPLPTPHPVLCTYVSVVSANLTLAIFYLTPGALYCDGAFRTKGFTGEGVRGSSVIVVKTHNNHPLFVGDRGEFRSRVGVFGSAILLVRNPMDALVSDWHRGRSNRKMNRTVSNHFLSVGEDWFGEMSLLHVWQSQVDNEHHSVAYFNCIAVFEALYL